MLRRIKDMSISKKLGILTTSSMLGVVVFTGSILVSEKELLETERRNGVLQAVETAHGVISYYQQQSASGKMSEQQAKDQALAVIKDMRYLEKEYFWINDMQPNMVLHPIKSELNGKPLSENKDPTGKHLFVEMVDVVKTSGSGFVYYMWPKPGSDTPVEKVSYVKGFKPWGWIIGSGVYNDTIHAIYIERVKKVLLGAGVLASLLLGISLLLSRNILKQLGGEPKQISNMMQLYADGDLRIKLDASKAHATSLVVAANDMHASISNIVTNVRTTTEEMVSATQAIVGETDTLRTQMDQQRTILQDTVAASEAIASTVRSTAENATQATQLAGTATTIASQGGKAVEQVVETMGSINASSKRIVEIIGVIDSIAFQTNILALNAAVEAARAGEQGRGFAVVASEVRSLAQRSASAAKEIKELINNSVEQVGVGSSQVELAGKTMVEVVTSIKRVNDLMSEMACANHEQVGQIAEMTRSVTSLVSEMDKNSSMVEHAAQTSTVLEEKADILSQVVSTFKV